MSLLEIPREPKRETLKVELTAEVLEELDTFVEFAKEEQPHATPNNVLEYIFEEFFASNRKDMKELRSWAESQSASEEQIKKGTKTQYESENSKAGVKSEAKTEDEPESSKTKADVENSKKKAKSEADQTGEMKVPRPEKRRIDRRKTSGEATHGT